MPIKLANNASGTLATAISASDTGIVLTSGNGALFPSLAAGEYFYATLASSGGTLEIVKVTARSGDSLTVVRAQEGTSAAGFAAGARFELRVTAQSVRDAIDDVNAAAVDFTPYGSISSTNVQSAIQEVVDEISILSTNTFTVEVITATAAQTVFNLSNPYVVGSVNLSVYMNGLRLRNVVDYVETNSTRVTLTSGAQAGDELTFVAGREVNDGLAASSVSFIPAGTGAIARTAQEKMRDTVSVLDFGADPTGATDSTAAIQAAIVSLRKNPRSILAYIGGPTITAYESGTLYVPEGVYKLQFDTFDITQDIGLTFVGLGSRGATNYSRGKSVFKFTGASSGFAFRFAHNGARNGRFVDMDVTYEGNTFTGHLIEVTGAQGFSAQGCFFGTDGDTAGTRYTSATSLIRPTYDEFLTLENCVLSGAQYGWYDDATITILGNTFGGSETKILNTVFYDFAVSAAYSSPSRTRLGLGLRGVSFNPITVAPTTCLDINNLDALAMSGCGFTPSTTYPPSVQWINIANVSGEIAACWFGDLAPAGTVSGSLCINGNYFFTTDGLTLKSGNIVSKANEFGNAGAGYIVSPTAAICFDLGPNQFKTGLTYSYDIPADSTFLSGRVYYDSTLDTSSSSFRNVSSRILIKNVDEKVVTTTSTSYTVSIFDTGRTIVATGTSPQTFTLPTPVAGTRLAISKLGNSDLTVNRGGASVFYTGDGAAKTSASAAAADIGGTITLEAYGTAGWRVVSVSGTWTFA
jgi:hypothetical protein